MREAETHVQGHRAFELIVRDHPRVILMVEPETGKIEYASDRALVFYGWTMNEMRRMTMDDLYVSDQVSEYADLILIDQKQNGKREDVSYIKHRDKFGHSHPVKLTPFSLKNMATELTGFLVCLLDTENCFSVGRGEAVSEPWHQRLDGPRKALLQNDLKKAIRTNEFFLVYQPIIDAHEKRVVGYEALIRWNHPTYGIILPGELFKLHFPGSFLMELDFFVLREVAKIAGDLEPQTMIHVNISAKNFHNIEFISKLSGFLNENIILKNRLILDFDDSLELLQGNEVRKLIEEQNLMVAVEDFGAGVISLTEIMRSKVHSLNIDMNLVKDISVNYASTVIIHAILKLSKSLGIEVVAKGVESPEQLRYLTKNGCRYLQGYLFGKPGVLEQIRSVESQVSELLENYFHVADKLEYVEQYAASEDLMMIELNRDCVMHLIPDGFLKLLGYDRKELAEKKFCELIREEDREVFLEEFRNLNEKVYFNDCLVHLRSKAGHMVYANISAHVSVYGSGMPILYVEDLSYLEDERLVFEGTRNSYKAIFKESPFAILIMNEDHECIDWNRKAEQVFGWTKGEVLRKSVSTIFPNVKEEFFESVLRKSLSEKLFVVSVNENIRKDGKVITCRWHNKAILDPQGRIQLIVSMAEDISDSIENSLLIKKMSLAMDLSGSMVMIMDHRGVITNSNSQLNTFFAAEGETLIGQRPKMFVDEGGTVPFGIIQKQLEKGVVWRGDFALKRADGNMIMCRVVFCPVKEEQTQTVSVVAIITDLSYEKEKDIQFMEIKKLLSEQEKLATIGSMLTGIIHEINNPLSYIDTNMLALEGILNEVDFPPGTDTFEIKDIIKDIKTGVQHIKAISASLKRMAFKGLHEEEEYFNIDEEIETVLNVAKNEYKYYALVDYEKEEDLYITGYPSGIRQVLLNLLINATHAIRKKFETSLGHIKVKSYKKEGWVIVEVSDNGSGIPESIRSEIFQTFFTTKKKGEGTGLGLSISKSIIEEKHGGSLDFTSVEGEGTTFIIKIPQERPSESQTDSFGQLL